MSEAYEIFVNHLKKIQNEIRVFHNENIDLPKVGFEKDHSEQLSRGMSRRDYVISLVEALEKSITTDYDEWFRRHNNYLASYEDEPIGNYIEALMRSNCMMRTASDLLNEIERDQ